MDFLMVPCSARTLAFQLFGRLVLGETPSPAFTLSPFCEHTSSPEWWQAQSCAVLVMSVVKPPVTAARQHSTLRMQYTGGICGHRATAVAARDTSHS